LRIIMEIWKEIEGYNGRYKVSSLGRVKSLVKKKPIIMKASASGPKGKQYRSVMLTGNGKYKRMKVSRLVATAFKENPENKPCVNHINGIKTDDRACNVEWNTYSENNKHAFDTGLKDPTILIGDDNGNARTTSNKVLLIREEYSGGEYTYKQLSLKYDLSESQIGNIVTGESWSHI